MSTSKNHSDRKQCSLTNPELKSPQPTYVCGECDCYYANTLDLCPQCYTPSPDYEMSKVSTPVTDDSNALPKLNKYERTIIGLDGTVTTVDVYRVLDAFPTTNPQLQHLAKKALCAGLRGHKDTMQDLIDIRDSINSAITLQEQKNAKHID